MPQWEDLLEDRSEVINKFTTWNLVRYHVDAVCHLITYLKAVRLPLRGER